MKHNLNSATIVDEKNSANHEKEGYKKTKLGWIPEEWDSVKFGDIILNSGYGPRFSANDYNENGNVKTIRGTDIGSNGNIIYDQVPIAKLPDSFIATHRIKDGDLVMITTADCGVTGVFQDDGFPYIPSAYAVRIRLNKEAGYPLYFKFLVQTPLFINQVNRFIRKGTVSNLPGSDIHRFDLALPPLQEQQKIAQILTTCDEAISKTEQLITKKQIRKKCLMQQLLTGKKRFKEFVKSDKLKKTKLGEIPEDWEEITFSEIADKKVKWSITGGPFGSDLKSDDFTKEGVRILQLQNLGDGQFLDKYKIYTSQEKADKLLACNIYPGELILSKMGDPVARACMIPNSESRYLMASDGIRLVPDQDQFDNYFVLEFINYSIFRKLAIRHSTGSTRQRIGLSDLKKLPFIRMSKKEQQKIGSTLSSANKEIDSLQNQLIKLKEQKKGLMQKLLTGEVRVKIKENKKYM